MKTVNKKELVDFETFLKALSEAYPNDPTTPGLVIANLKRNGMYYFSIKRYTERYGEGGYVVLARQSTSIVQAYNDLKNAWLEQMDPGKSALKTLINKNRA